MSWAVRAVQLPDGDRPADLWVDAAGCLVTEPVPGAEPLPGRYVVPGLVDAHAHPAVGREAGMPVALDGSEALNVLAAWAACGVCLVRDTGSAGGSVLELDLVSGMPRLQAAGRFLAPAGRYFPALLPEAAPPERLAELAPGEPARGGMDGENDRKPREERFPVMFMCEMLEVSRQGYYAWKKRAPSARQKEDVTLTTLIVAIHNAHKGRYGIDQIHADLARNGYQVSREAGTAPGPGRWPALRAPAAVQTTTVQDPANACGLVDLVGRDFVPGARTSCGTGISRTFSR